jgi:protein translocase SecG subunit
MYTVLMVIFIIDVALLIPTILMQSGSGAEAGMFGSSLTMGAFGAKTSEVLVKFTRWLVAIFMVSAFLLGFLKVREHKRFAVEPATVETMPAPDTDTERSPEESRGLIPSEIPQEGAPVLPMLPENN